MRRFHNQCSPLQALLQTMEKNRQRENKVCNKTRHVAADDKDGGHYHRDDNKKVQKFQSSMLKSDLMEYKGGKLPRLVIDDAEVDNHIAENINVVETVTWNDVGKASDVFFFFFTLLAFAVSHVAYFVY